MGTEGVGKEEEIGTKEEGIGISEAIDSDGEDLVCSW